jgi:hypothetical protein
LAQPTAIFKQERCIDPDVMEEIGLNAPTVGEVEFQKLVKKRSELQAKRNNIEEQIHAVEKLLRGFGVN